MLHEGRIYQEGDVSLRPSDHKRIRSSPKSSDVQTDVEEWLSASSDRDDIYYFSIYYQEDLVGQIILHDIDWQSGEALVAYHFFQPHQCRRGIGTQLLGLLQQFAIEWANFTRLSIITSIENLELISRIRALLRRTYGEFSDTDADLLYIGGLVIDRTRG